jgi:7-carboxy-7-deazaguanine synthase
MAKTPDSDSGAVSNLSRTLKVNEIFYSLQGESSRTGLPTVFVRLTGCPLRCHYCDTEYAFYNGKKKTISEILHEIKITPVEYVCVTGGEPLAQKYCKALLNQLCDEGYKVSVETSGAMDINDVDVRVSRIVDFKTPGSGEVARNLMENIQYLRGHDEVKFVICNREDYDWSSNFLREHELKEKCEVLFSPSHAVLEAKQLAEWILDDKLPVRFQTQLHKQLWGDKPGH